MTSPHLASRLKHRITLQQPLLTSDGQGGYSRSWQDVDSLWAEIVPLASISQQQERLFAGKLSARTSHRINIRYRTGVTTEMRLSEGGRNFSILAVIDPTEKGELLQILVELETGI